MLKNFEVMIKLGKKKIYKNQVKFVNEKEAKDWATRQADEMKLVSPFIKINEVV